MTTTDNKNNKSFEDYRRQMHPEQEEGRSVVPAPGRIVATCFAILMIVVYIGMGVLLFINFFGWDPNWTWARIFIGVVLVIYGLFRAYRSFIYHN